MEDVLAVYARPYDENRPVICMDEKPYQCLSLSQPPLPMKPSSPQREDYSYIRLGTCSIFIFTEPLSGWRFAHALAQRTKKDWAHHIQWLLNEQYLVVEKIVLVMDNLNTHTLSSLYETFSPETAFRLAQGLEIHYTPVHRSWLNRAEIELAAMAAQCLGQRCIPGLKTMNEELTAWHTQRNQAQKGVDGQFTTSDARIKLKRLYYPISL